MYPKRFLFGLFHHRLLLGFQQTGLLYLCSQSRLFLVLIALFILMVIAGGLASFFLFTPTATITLVPKSMQIQATGNITVVTARADTTNNEIPGRMLSPIIMSQTEIVATTGRTYLAAREVRGTITFYNASLS